MDQQNVGMSQPPVNSQPAPHLPPIITTVIVTALVVGFGVYWFVKPVSAPTPNESPIASSASSINTTGWKTYTNVQYGFEFQYPKDRKLVEGRPQGDQNADWYIYLKDSSGGLNIVFTVNSKMDYGPLVQDGAIIADGVVFDRKYIGFGGNNWAKNAPSIYESEKGNIDIVTEYKNRTLVEQILSTFRFTK